MINIIITTYHELVHTLTATILLYYRPVLLRDQEGILRSVYPTPIALIGDIQAVNGALMVNSGHLTKMPDVSYLVPGDQQDDTTTQFPKRNQSEMVSTWRKATATVAQAEAARYRTKKERPKAIQTANQQALQLLKSVSLSKLPLWDTDIIKKDKKGIVQLEIQALYAHNGTKKVLQPALVGFNFVDAFQLPAPDQLHTVEKGPADQLVNGGSPNGFLCNILENHGSAVGVVIG